MRGRPTPPSSSHAKAGLPTATMREATASLQEELQEVKRHRQHLQTIHAEILGGDARSRRLAELSDYARRRLPGMSSRERHRVLSVLHVRIGIQEWGPAQHVASEERSRAALAVRCPACGGGRQVPCLSVVGRIHDGLTHELSDGNVGNQTDGTRTSYRLSTREHLMQRRPRGLTGLTVSEIGYGAWCLGGAGWIYAEEGESVRTLNGTSDGRSATAATAGKRRPPRLGRTRCGPACSTLCRRATPSRSTWSAVPQSRSRHLPPTCTAAFSASADTGDPWPTAGPGAALDPAGLLPSCFRRDHSSSGLDPLLVALVRVGVVLVLSQQWLSRSGQTRTISLGTSTATSRSSA